MEESKQGLRGSRGQFRRQADLRGKIARVHDVAEQRPHLAQIPVDPQIWAAFIDDVRHHIVGRARADLVDSGWQTSDRWHSNEAATQIRAIIEDIAASRPRRSPLVGCSVDTEH
jgi:hypothetical protein